jgi:hypothetical protein
MIVKINSKRNKILYIPFVENDFSMKDYKDYYYDDFMNRTTSSGILDNEREINENVKDFEIFCNAMNSGEERLFSDNNDINEFSNDVLSYSDFNFENKIICQSENMYIDNSSLLNLDSTVARAFHLLFILKIRAIYYYLIKMIL